MTVLRSIGVYWTRPKDELPEDAVMCVFHRKRIRADRIHFGGYSERFGFWDRSTGKWYTRGKVDYWMPIPVLPEKEGR